jgi:hypothetical protein
VILLLVDDPPLAVRPPSLPALPLLLLVLVPPLLPAAALVPPLLPAAALVPAWTGLPALPVIPAWPRVLPPPELKVAPPNDVRSAPGIPELLVQPVANKAARMPQKVR